MSAGEEKVAARIDAGDMPTISGRARLFFADAFSLIGERRGRDQRAGAPYRANEVSVVEA